MFVGHYAAALALKKVEKRAPLAMSGLVRLQVIASLTGH